MRTAKLADESADRLAHRGRDEVELTSLGRPPRMAGFAVSGNGRFSAVHRGLRLERRGASPSDQSSVTLNEIPDRTRTGTVARLARSACDYRSSRALSRRLA